MTAVTIDKPTKAKHPLISLREHFDARQGELKNALPVHISPEKFIRVALTAVGLNTDLLAADRQSLWNSCLKCASDGLLPDGREAALVTFGNKVQYLPMIQGLRKKARNAGDMLNWEAHVVYENDEFNYEEGDKPFIKHKPLIGADRGKPIAAYSIAWLSDGVMSREVMSIGEIEAVRKKSRASKGPWDDATFYPEMCRKTVARRHSKSLPLSADVDQAIARDDEMYELKPALVAAQPTHEIKNVSEALDAFGSEPAQEGAEIADEFSPNHTKAEG